MSCLPSHVSSRFQASWTVTTCGIRNIQFSLCSRIELRFQLFGPWTLEVGFAAKIKSHEKDLCSFMMNVSGFSSPRPFSPPPLMKKRGSRLLGWPFYLSVFAEATPWQPKTKGFPKEAFWFWLVAGTGFEPVTFGLWAQRATGLLHPATNNLPWYHRRNALSRRRHVNS